MHGFMPAGKEQNVQQQLLYCRAQVDEPKERLQNFSADHRRYLNINNLIICDK
jgi:hypothetical protein